ncbi:MAG TPA: hypothetical protein VIH29_11885 [Gallionella sp.]
MADKKYNVILTAQDQTRAAFDSARRSVQGLNSVLGTLGIGLSVAGFASLIKGSIDSADALVDLHEKTGTSIKDLAGLKFAAEQNSTSLEAVAMAGKKLAVTLSDKPELFARMGITAQDSTGAMIQLADVFAGMPDGVNKTALAVKLMGKNGEEMIPFMNIGSAALRDYITKGREYANVSEDSARQAKRFNDQLAELKTQSEGSAMSLANLLLPNLTQTATAMNELAREGHPVLALWRALAGMGQVPWDLLMPPNNLAESLKSANRLKELKSELAGIQNNLAETGGRGGLVGRWLHGTREEQLQQVEILKNQIAVLEKHGAELDKKAPASAAAANSGKGRALLSGLGVGDSGMNDAIKLQIAQEKELRDAALEAQKIIYDIDPLSKAADYWEHLVELKDRGLITEEQIGRAYLKTYQAAEESAKKSSEAWQTFADNTQRTLSDVIYKGFNGTFDDIGELFKQMLLRMAADAAALSITSSAIPFLKNLLDGWGGGVPPVKVLPSGGVLTANGAAFDGGMASFARGGAFTNGLFNSPTPFRFAGGGGFNLGVMGEAGPEAVMPLTRGRDGKLGVQAQGGGGITIYNNPTYNVDSRTDRAEVIMSMERVARNSNAELVDKLQRAGVI